MSNDGRFHPNHLFFWCLFVFFFGGHCCLSRWESFGIDDSALMNFPLFQVASNESMKQFLGIRNVRLDAFAHTHILPGILPPKWPHENFWMSCLSFIGSYWFWCDNIPLKTCGNPNMSKNAVSPTSLNRFKPSTKRTKTLHIFSIREDVSEKEHGIPLVFSEKNDPTYDYFSPPEWIDFSMRSVFQLNIADPLNLEMRGRFKGTQLISTSWEKLRWSVDERSFLPRSEPWKNVQGF